MSEAKVLLVDDSVTIRKVFELAFEDEPLELLLADSAESAMEAALRERPDFVIADLNMPGASGLDLIQALRNKDAFRATPLYLLVSALEEFDFEQAARVGADGRFEKPFKPEELIDSIKKILASRSTSREDEREDEEDKFDDIDVSSLDFESGQIAAPIGAEPDPLSVKASPSLESEPRADAFDARARLIEERLEKHDERLALLEKLSEERAERLASLETRISDFPAQIEPLLARALEARMQSQATRELIDSATRERLDSIKGDIAGYVERITKKIALAIAAKAVKETIDNIKGETG